MKTSWLLLRLDKIMIQSEGFLFSTQSFCCINQYPSLVFQHSGATAGKLSGTDIWKANCDKKIKSQASVVFTHRFLVSQRSLWVVQCSHFDIAWHKLFFHYLHEEEDFPIHNIPWVKTSLEGHSKLRSELKRQVYPSPLFPKMCNSYQHEQKCGGCAGIATFWVHSCSLGKTSSEF